MPVSGGAIVDAKKMQAQKDADKERIKKLKRDHNDYVDWVEQKGLKYSRTLDVGDGDENAGNKLLKEYIKTHPKTSLKSTKEGIEEVQSLVRDVFESIKNKGESGQLSGPELSKTSKVDGKYGSITSARKFPESKFLNKTTGKVYYGGFITPDDIAPDLPPTEKAEMQAAMQAGQIQKFDEGEKKTKLSVPKKPATTQAQKPMTTAPQAPMSRPEIIRKQEEDIGDPVYGPYNSLIGFVKDRQFSPASGQYRVGMNKKDIDLLEGNIEDLNKYLNLKTQGIAQPYVRPLPTK